MRKTTVLEFTLLNFFKEEKINNIGLIKKKENNFKICQKLLITNPVNKSHQPFHHKAPQKHQHLIKQVNPSHLHAFLLKKSLFFMKKAEHHCLNL